MQQNVVQPVDGHRGMGSRRKRFTFGTGFSSKRPGRTLPELDPPASHKTITHRLERRYAQREISQWESEMLRDFWADWKKWQLDEDYRGFDADLSFFDEDLS